MPRATVRNELAALAQTRFARLATLVQLYEALGGGWQLAEAGWDRPEVASER